MFSAVDTPQFSIFRYEIPHIWWSLSQNLIIGYLEKLRAKKWPYLRDVLPTRKQLSGNSSTRKNSCVTNMTKGKQNYFVLTVTLMVLFFSASSRRRHLEMPVTQCLEPTYTEASATSTMCPRTLEASIWVVCVNNMLLMNRVLCTFNSSCKLRVLCGAF